MTLTHRVHLMKLITSKGRRFSFPLSTKQEEIVEDKKKEEIKGAKDDSTDMKDWPYKASCFQLFFSRPF